MPLPEGVAEVTGEGVAAVQEVVSVHAVTHLNDNDNDNDDNNDNDIYQCTGVHAVTHLTPLLLDKHHPGWNKILIASVTRNDGMLSPMRVSVLLGSSDR